MKKRSVVTTCMICGLLLAAGCGNTAAQTTTTTPKAESVESVENTKSTENMENTESMESVAETETAAATGWADGTYTETATGKEGDFEVTVVIEGGAIASVTIGDNVETRGQIAIDQLPAQIVEAQSYDVDTVSGATVTSTGIKDAVARVLEKAAQ